jgi:hypothetical protein
MDGYDQQEMPRISHMVAVTNASQIDNNLMELLRKANNNVNT